MAKSQTGPATFATCEYSTDGNDLVIRVKNALNGTVATPNKNTDGTPKGKGMLASSGGFQQVAQHANGEPLYVSLNAMVRVPKS